MSSSNQTNESLNNETNIEINESQNLIFKLYATLLTNSAVQNGLKQLTRLSQPIRGKFEDNVVMLTTNVNKCLALNNKDVLKLILNFIQENTFFYGDFSLNLVEKRIDVILKLVGHKQEEEKVEDKTLAEKVQRILKKVFILSGYPLKKIEEVFHQIQSTKTYITIDNYLHLNARIDDTIYLTTWSYNMLKENILQPSVDTIKVFHNKAKSQVTIIVHDLDVQILKKKYKKLQTKYEVLQKCVVIVAGETVKLVFDKKALTELGENGKKELLKIYHELKSMETKKIKDISVEYYKTILKKAQKTYSEAHQAVQNQNREGEDEKADSYGNYTHPQNLAGREATEKVALECN
jgi:uncharacterized protein YhhL (DUF1145 family)